MPMPTQTASLLDMHAHPPPEMTTQLATFPAPHDISLIMTFVEMRQAEADEYPALLPGQQACTPGRRGLSGMPRQHREGFHWRPSRFEPSLPLSAPARPTTDICCNGLNPAKGGRSRAAPPPIPRGCGVIIKLPTWPMAPCWVEEKSRLDDARSTWQGCAPTSALRDANASYRQPWPIGPGRGSWPPQSCHAAC